MTDFVLDNAVSMRRCFDQCNHVYADGILRALDTGQAVVPAIWRYEVSSVLSRSLHRGEITLDHAALFQPRRRRSAIVARDRPVD